MLYGWTSDNGDPDNFLNVLLGCKAAQPGGANLARWCDPAYEALVQAARRTGDRATRVDLYRKAQGLVGTRCPGCRSPTRKCICFCARTSPVSRWTRSAATCSMR